MVRPLRTAVRPLVVLLVTGLWIALSGWTPAHRVAEERERACKSACHDAIAAVAEEQRKRPVETKRAPRLDAAECPPRIGCPIPFSEQLVTSLSRATDSVRTAELRSTRARGPPSSRA